MRSPRLAAAPTSPAVGEQYYDTTNSALYYWNGAFWVSGGGGSTMCARAYRNAVFTTGANAFTKVPLDTTSFDTSGMVQTGNGRVVAPVAGYYQVDAAVGMAAGAGDQQYSFIYVNGVSRAQGVRMAQAGGGLQLVATDVIQCNAGDYVELYVFTVTANAVITGAAATFLSVALLTSLPGAVGPATAARAYRNAALTTAAGAWTKVSLDTISSDPGGNMSTVNGRYTAPATGTYQVNGSIALIPGASDAVIAGVYLNGTIRSQGARISAPLSGQTCNVTVSDVISMNAGDYVELWVFTSVADALTGFGVSANYLSVVQVGNSMNFTAAGGDLKGTYPNPLVAPAYVTSLPASPVDGQQCYYLADATNGIVWHLRYRAASASAHKWEFVGGGKIVVGPMGTMTITSTAVTPVSGGPTYSIPLPGDYRVQHGAWIQLTGTGTAQMEIWLGSNGGPVGIGAIVVGLGQFGGANVSVINRINNFLTGDALNTLAQSNVTASCAFTNAYLEIEPIRLG